MFVPEQHYTNDERKCRVVNEMNTGDWWWSVQVHNITYYERELTLRISLRRPLNHTTSVFSHFSFQGFLVLVQAKQANKVEK